MGGWCAKTILAVQNHVSSKHYITPSHCCQTKTIVRLPPVVIFSSQRKWPSEQHDNMTPMYLLTRISLAVALDSRAISSVSKVAPWLMA